MRPALQRILNRLRRNRPIRLERIEAAAAHIVELVCQHIAHGAQFALIASFAQNPCGGIAAPVAEHREVHFHQPDMRQMRDQVAGIIARLDPHGFGIGLVEEGDEIEIDIRARRIDLLVDQSTLAERRRAMEARGAAAWKPTEKRERMVSTALKAYAAFALSASEGAARDVDRFEQPPMSDAAD